MKKIIALLLIFCMASPFASCTKEETVKKEEPPERGGILRSIITKLFS